MAFESEGAECCILEICCGGEHQIEQLAMKIEAATHIGKPKSLEVAAWIIGQYDLAPAGTLRAFKRAISEMAREYPPEPGY
jgi:hypothetical protein